MPETHQSAAGSDVGKTRQTNQDSLGVFEPVSAICSDSLYILCDGMGAYLGGEIASKLAVGEIIRIYRNKAGSSPIKEVLMAAISQANAEIRSRSKLEEKIHEMGTTVVLLLIHGEESWIANVGDSRAYLVRDNHIRQLSVDHSQVNAMVQAGVITRQQAQGHKHRNILTQVLSATHATAEPEIICESLRPGDVFVLCSDGLWGQVREDKIQTIVQSYPPHQAIQRLISMANQAGGDDNISVIVVEYGQPLQKIRKPLPVMGRIFKNPWFVVALLAILIAGAALAVFAFVLMNGPRP